MVKIDHQKMPLRQIVRRETQNGQPFVVLVCGHVAPGKPASRSSRFFPCPECHEEVERLRRGHRAGDDPHRLANAL